MYEKVSVIDRMIIIDIYFIILKIYKVVKSGSEIRYFLFRTNDDSLARGVLTSDMHEYGNKRRMVSLKICFVSWLLEFSGVLMTLLTPTLRSLGVHYLYYFDAILMFLVIPFIHLMNDEDMKSCIIEHGWCKGILQLVGIKHEDKIQP